MKPPLLSICIPTFNRVNYLQDLLPRFVDELAALGDSASQSIELVVSNNASTDETEAYVLSLRIPCLRYYRNERNIGGDANFLACIERATGDYVWLFGDDDLLLPDGIARILTVIGGQGPDLLILDGTEPAVRAYPSYRCCLETEMRTQPMFPLIHTLITSNVFRRRAFDLPLGYRTLCMNYAHAFGLMRNISRSGRVAVMGAAMATRPQRAQFEKWPFALCVKQGIYLCCLARWANFSPLYWRGARLAMNLPLELISRAVHRLSPRRFERT